MNPLNDNIPTNSVHDDLRYNAAYLQKDIPFSLTQAISFHAELETRCDAVIQEQDDLIRTVTLRCQAGAALEKKAAALFPTSVATEQTETPAFSNGAKPLAQSSLAPLVSPAFGSHATEAELDEIETLEFEIIELRQRMTFVEKEITKYNPLTPMDTARKLQFLARLVADGGEVDMHAFAQLVDEGAGMLLTALGEVGFF
jgi:hypothetical protein